MFPYIIAEIDGSHSSEPDSAAKLEALGFEVHFLAIAPCVAASHLGRHYSLWRNIPYATRNLMPYRIMVGPLRHTKTVWQRRAPFTELSVGGDPNQRAEA